LTDCPLACLSDDALFSLLCQAEGLAPVSLAMPNWLGVPPLEIERRLGLSTPRATVIAAALELGRRDAVCEAKAMGRAFSGGLDVYRYLAPRMAGKRVEAFWVLCLDAKGHLLWEECVSKGTLTSSLVHPREVFSSAVLHRAASIVVAHNHPSGDPEPSAQDRATTRRLQRAGKLLGIELLDHLILASGGWVSFLEKGWL